MKGDNKPNTTAVENLAITGEPENSWVSSSSRAPETHY
jgi:hypothetical protein